MPGSSAGGPEPASGVLYERFVKASGRVFDGAGTDPTWARRVNTAMVACGLTNVHTVIHGSYWRGGDIATRMVAGTIPQITGGLLENGLSEADIDAALRLLDDPRLLVQSHLLYSTVGYLPHR